MLKQIVRWKDVDFKKRFSQGRRRPKKKKIITTGIDSLNRPLVISMTFNMGTGTFELNKEWCPVTLNPKISTKHDMGKKLLQVALPWSPPKRALRNPPITRVCSETLDCPCWSTGADLQLFYRVSFLGVCAEKLSSYKPIFMLIPLFVCPLNC